MRISIRGVRQEHNIDGLEMNPTDHVSILRLAVRQHLPDLPDLARIRLIHAGRLMQDHELLSDFNLTDGGVAHVVLGPATDVQPSNSTSTPSPATTTTTADPTTALLQGLVPAVITAINADQSSMASVVSSVLAGLAHPQSAGGPAPPGAAPPVAVQFPTVAPPTAAPVSAGSSAAGGAPPVVGGVPLAQGGQPATIFSLPTAPMHTVHHVNVQRTVQPPIAGVYLHLHCNMDQLDEVPRRLAALGQSVGHTVPIVSAQVQQPTNSRAADATEAPQPEAQRVRRETLAAAVRAAAAVPSSAAAAAQQQQQPTPHAAGAAAQPASSNDDDDDDADGYLDQVVEPFIQSLDFGAMMQLLQGNFSVVVASREAMRSRLLRLQSTMPNTNFAELQALDFFHALVDEPSVQRALSEQLRPNGPTCEQIRAEIYSFLLRFSSFLFSTFGMPPELTDAQWIGTLRAGMIHFVAALVRRGSGWFVGGREAIYAIMDAVVQVLIREGSHEMPQFQAVLPLALRMLRPLMVSWSENGGQPLSNLTDVMIFELAREAPPPRPATTTTTQPAATPAPVAATTAHAAPPAAPHVPTTTVPVATVASPSPAEGSVVQPGENDDLADLIDELMEGDAPTPAATPIETAVNRWTTAADLSPEVGSELRELLVRAVNNSASETREVGNPSGLLQHLRGPSPSSP